jgi:hypothetical protein
MAFQLGDVRGAKTSGEARHGYKQRPVNMLERSQNVPNEKTRASWDRMYKPDQCNAKDCEEYSDILGKCLHPSECTKTFTWDREEEA